MNKSEKTEKITFIIQFYILCEIYCYYKIVYYYLWARLPQFLNDISGGHQHGFLRTDTFLTIYLQRIYIAAKWEQNTVEQPGINMKPMVKLGEKLIYLLVDSTEKTATIL
jgi:hypothetical protein